VVLLILLLVSKQILKDLNKNRAIFYNKVDIASYLTEKLREQTNNYEIENFKSLKD
jgi:cell division protein FtsX